jgi:vancomycin resistance protein VanJ
VDPLLLDWYGLRFAVESVLRWLGTAVVLLAVAALALREPWALVFVAAPALVWTSCFVPQMMPLDPASGDRGLMVASQNVEAGNADLDRTVGTVLSRSPDVFALEEYTGGLSSAMADRVDAGWPHHVHIGTVAIFSRYEIVDDEALGLGHGWTRAFSAVIPAPHGDVTVYVVHADSARATDHSGRDAMLGALADVVKDAHASRLVVIGDFNAGSDDTALTGLRSELYEPAQSRREQCDVNVCELEPWSRWPRC